MKKKALKFCAFALCSMMAFSIPMTSIPVYAVESTSITIEQGAEDSVYTAYKILNLTSDGTNYSYSLNPKYENALKNVTGLSTEAEIINYISELDAAGIREFADDVYLQIKNLGSDATSVNQVFSNVEQGYYLIAESVKSADPDTYSLVMLDTKGQEDITVKTKEDTITVEKKVLEVNDSSDGTPGYNEYQDAADYDIGDRVKFRIESTIPENYDSFTTYTFKVHDQLSAGLEYDWNDTQVKIGDVTMSNGQGVAYEYNWNNDNKLIFNFNDLKTNGNIKAGDKVVIEYYATLTENAVIGSEGNANEVYIEYSNNPYETGTGETVKDKVIVFTYKLDVDKLNETGEVLSGARFELQKYDLATQTWISKTTFETNGTTKAIPGLDAGKYRLIETQAPNGYNIIQEPIEFDIVGTYDALSDNPALTDLDITSPNASVNEETGLVTFDGNLVQAQATVNTGVIDMDVTNKSGLELPETGGVGTTLFYIFGSVLVISSSVILITKKRASKMN
jgi:fimbrial isopeptide formation D2 family protein/LPXTG-motif cell wall-anchored protein